jgi:hypothetical protein
LHSYLAHRQGVPGASKTFQNPERLFYRIHEEARRHLRGFHSSPLNSHIALRYGRIERVETYTENDTTASRMNNQSAARCILRKVGHSRRVFREDLVAPLDQYQPPGVGKALNRAVAVDFLAWVKRRNC